MTVPFFAHTPYLLLHGEELIKSYSELSGKALATQLGLLLFLLLLNAFFVAAEFALLKVRAALLEESNGNGKSSAQYARKVVENPDRYLSTCQIGITLCSILLGAVSEPFISMLLQPALGGIGLEEITIRWISFIVAILIIAGLHFVIAEQLPRTLAIRNSRKTATISARPLHFAFLGLCLLVFLYDSAVHAILKYIFKVEPTEGHRVVHTVDELRILVEETGEAHEVTATEQEIAINALELSELSVKDILTPRSEVVTMDIHKTFEENLHLAVESKHTRFPLVDEHLDKTLGLIHIKDLISVLHERSSSPPDLFKLKRDIINVPETLALDEMLKTFLGAKAHIALVNDEFGGSVGLVMLDDVLDQIVGNISDEFDDEEIHLRRLSETEFVVDGTLPLHELADEVEDLDLEHPEVTTVGGYLTSVLGRLPEEGETAEIEGYIAEVTKADERYVHEISFTKVDPDEEEETSRQKEAAAKDESGDLDK